jgi:hypothetical protein
MLIDEVFKRAKVATSLYREADRLYYDAVAEEMQQGQRDDGLWLMAFERAEGDETRTKAFYIGLRVKRLKEQATIMAAASDPTPTRAGSRVEHPRTDDSSPESKDDFWGPWISVFWIIAALFALVIFVALLG